MIDLLVVNYNTKEKLQRFVDTLNSDYEPDVWRLYIQDNGSTDGSRDLLTELFADRLNNIEGIRLENNVGYARAINNLANASHNEILCAVNADTWFTTNHVKEVAASFEAPHHANAAVIGVKQKDESGAIRHGGIFWGGVYVQPHHRGWGEGDGHDFKYKDDVPCWTVSGSIYYMRRSVWNELRDCPAYQSIAPGAGAFLPTPHFFEETFFSVHAQKHGYEVWYDGTIETAGHTWHASSNVGEASRKWFEESRNLYITACDVCGIPHEYQSNPV